ncbi:MAG TPA: Rrf2 family transcriptional regulator [Bryobacteraceae bacterium]|nr:Rrf2 family transcriptional regulator [Bryobacteraceae bacterium]
MEPGIALQPAFAGPGKRHCRLTHLMNISVKGEYALEAIFDLASHSGDKPVKIADIAQRQRIPQKFLELILASLKQGGFVESRRGAEGGYLLARRPESITVGEVLKFVEGRGEERSRQRRKPQSPFTDLWDRVDNAVDHLLENTSFANLVREWTERNARFVPNWEI